VSQVAQTEDSLRVAPAPARTWNDRLFDAIPLPAPWVGVLLAGLLLALLWAIAELSGEWSLLEQKSAPLWSIRDARVAVLISLLAAGMPAVLRLHDASTRRNARALVEAGEVEADRLRVPGGGARWVGWASMLLLPLVALSVDRDPGVYFLEGYWTATKVWYWLLGFACCFATGTTIARVVADALRFSRLGRGLRHLDLLDASALAPFGRQALRSTVPGLFVLSIFAANLADRDFAFATAMVGGLALGISGATLLLPLRGVHARVQEAKRQELARVHAAIRGEPGALRGSPLAARPAPDLAELLAWRAAVQQVPEWPIDAGTRLRFLAFLGIPLLSWVGGALVEHGLDWLLAHS
jgi:hypothetical protein